MLTGGMREEQEGFVRLRTHYVFEARFCNPAKGNEKGMVENLVGYSRRNFLVPVPETDELDDLNTLLLTRCEANRRRRRDRRQERVEELLEIERSKLLDLPAQRFDCCRRRSVHTDHCSRFQFETNRYSVPFDFADQELTLKAYVDRLDVFAADRLVATHKRSYERHKDCLELDHYLEVLARKPGALQNAKPWRQANVPTCYRRVFDELKGSAQGCREFVDILILRRDGVAEAVDRAVAIAVDRGLGRLDVIEHLLRQEDEQPATVRHVAVRESLQEITVPVIDLGRYDGLMGGGERVPA